MAQFHGGASEAQSGVPGQTWRGDLCCRLFNIHDSCVALARERTEPRTHTPQGPMAMAVPGSGAAGFGVCGVVGFSAA